jgi:hypothetical protein
MASADRDLRLPGYEVYRFGAKELLGDDAADIVTSFFECMSERHKIGRRSR